jgi:hypothetical protein
VDCVGTDKIERVPPLIQAWALANDRAQRTSRRSNVGASRLVMGSATHPLVGRPAMPNGGAQDGHQSIVATTVDTNCHWWAWPPAAQ